MGKLKSVFSGKSLLLMSIGLLVAFILFIGISYLTETPPNITDLKITNVSDGSVTVAYFTDVPTYGSIVVSENNDFNLFNQLSKSKFYDDRNDGVLRTSHHITIKDLSAETPYYFKVMGNLKEVTYEYPTIVTGKTLDSLRTPDPSYGKFLSADLNTVDLKAFIDGIVYLNLNGGAVQSALINAQGGFTFDKTNVRTQDLSSVVNYKTGDEIIVTLITKDKNVPVKSKVGEDQPIRINELKTTLVPSKLINPLNTNLVGSVNAGPSDCGGHPVGATYCNPGNGINYVCNAGQDGPNAGWKDNGTCGSTPAPTPAPAQENQAGSVAVNNEGQTQQVVSLKCNGGQFDNGDFCHIDHYYNCKGARDGNGTITSYNRTCNPASSSQNSSGAGSTSGGTGTVSNNQNASPCKGKGYGLWCDGDNLLDCDGKGNGTSKSCASGCAPQASGTPDRCKDSKDVLYEKKEETIRNETGLDRCTNTSNCSANIKSGSFSKCYEGGGGEAVTSKICCAGGYTLNNSGNTCYKCDAGYTFNESSNKCEANKRPGISPAPSEVALLPECSGSHNPAKPSSNSSACSFNGATHYSCNSPYILSGSDCKTQDQIDIAALPDCGSADTRNSNTANSTACKKNGVRTYKCNSTYSWESDRCVNSQSQRSPRITLNNNLVSDVNAQMVLGVSDGSKATTVNVNEEGVYKIDSVAGYAVPSSEVKVTKNADGTAEIKFFLDKNGNGVKDDGEEYITTPLEVKLEKQQDLSTYNLSIGWNLISWNNVDNKIKTGMDLLNKIADEGGYATHIATYRNGGWVLLSQRSGEKFGKDFDLVPNEGYFVKVLKAVELNIEGTKIAKDQDMFFSTGWNLIGYRSELKTAKSLIEEVNKNTSLDMDTVTRFESSRYENLVKDSGTYYGNDFSIVEGKGYFVRLKKGGAVWKR